MMKLLFFIFCFFSLCVLSCQSQNKPVDVQINELAPNDSVQSIKQTPIQSDTLTSFPFLKGKNDIQMSAPDSLTIYGVLYHQSPQKPIIVLCHQAGSSKDEYTEIAPQLNALGFNCLAIDQRSGGNRLGGVNQTAAAAEKKGKDTNYLAAEQDITTAIAFASGIYNKPVILLGSSYSASLVLKIAKSNPEVSAVIAFSPGEYFSNRSETFVLQQMKGLDKPLFITSSKSEAPLCKPFFNAATSTNKMQFIPGGEGIHGARSLWKSTSDNAEYWKELKDFLKRLQ